MAQFKVFFWDMVNFINVFYLYFMLKIQPWNHSFIISIQIIIDFKYYKLNFNSSNQMEHNFCLSFNLFSYQPEIETVDRKFKFNKSLLCSLSHFTLCEWDKNKYALDMHRTYLLYERYKKPILVFERCLCRIENTIWYDLRSMYQNFWCTICVWR